MKKNAQKFRGVGVALVTPFKSDSSLDEAALERLIDFQIEQGTNFLVPCGTTGENPTLTHGEHRRVGGSSVGPGTRRGAGPARAGSKSTRKGRWPAPAAPRPRAGGARCTPP